MIIILGAIIVTASVLGGFMMAGGHLGALDSGFRIRRHLRLGRAARSIIMSPKKVLVGHGTSRALGTLERRSLTTKKPTKNFSKPFTSFSCSPAETA